MTRVALLLAGIAPLAFAVPARKSVARVMRRLPSDGR